METNQDLMAEYRQRFGSHSSYRDAVWKMLVANYFQRFISADAAVLDLGAGWGEFIRHVRAGRRLAMDLNPDMPARVGKAVEPLLQDCSTQWQIDSNSLDVIFTSNFFEHLPNKPALRRTVLEAHRCLRSGGKIMCLGPNIRYIPQAYWDFWDHHVALTDRSLCELLTISGFCIDLCQPRFLPYSMSQGFQPPPWLVAVYLRVPLAWPFLGKQFFIIARKL